MAVIFELAGFPSITAGVRNPEFGEQEELNVKSRLHLSMDGTVFTYKNTPSSNKIAMEYKVVKRVDMDLLLDFLTATAGMFLKFTDWKGNIRFGRIVTDIFSVIVIDSTCELETSFEFEETTN